MDYINQELIKLGNNLLERLLLGEPGRSEVLVAPHGETVLYAVVQVDLVRLLGAGQDLLEPVAYLLGEEDDVRLCGGHGQRAGDGRELRPPRRRTGGHKF